MFDHLKNVKTISLQKNVILTLRANGFRLVSQDEICWLVLKKILFEILIRIGLSMYIKLKENQK